MKVGLSNNIEELVKRPKDLLLKMNQVPSLSKQKIEVFSRKFFLLKKKE